MMYKPDGWLILKFTDNSSENNNQQQPFFKVFGSFNGGYQEGDSWRLSSGAFSFDNAVINDDYVDWGQHSGSLYRLNKWAEGQLTTDNHNQLTSIIEQVKEAGMDIEIISLETMSNQK